MSTCAELSAAIVGNAQQNGAVVSAIVGPKIKQQLFIIFPGWNAFAIFSKVMHLVLLSSLQYMEDGQHFQTCSSDLGTHVPKSY